MVAGKPGRALGKPWVLASNSLNGPIGMGPPEKFCVLWWVAGSPAGLLRGALRLERILRAAFPAGQPRAFLSKDRHWVQPSPRRLSSGLCIFDAQGLFSVDSLCWAQGLPRSGQGGDT